MPLLPTHNVTDAQAQRMLGAYGSQEAYLAWLKEQIIEFVIAKESQRIFEIERARYEQIEIEKQAALAALRASLTG